MPNLWNCFGILMQVTSYVSFDYKSFKMCFDYNWIVKWDTKFEIKLSFNFNLTTLPKYRCSKHNNYNAFKFFNLNRQSCKMYSRNAHIKYWGYVVLYVCFERLLKKTVWNINEHEFPLILFHIYLCINCPKDIAIIIFGQIWCWMLNDRYL